MSTVCGVYTTMFRVIYITFATDVLYIICIYYVYIYTSHIYYIYVYIPSTAGGICKTTCSMVYKTLATDVM